MSTCAKPKLTSQQVDAITNEAHAIHMTTLEKWGNKPQDQQRATLRALVRMFAEMFAGTVRGRYPWPLPTGAGKTTALVSVIVALENLKIAGPSLAVGSSTVEALCRIRRELEAAGVSSDKIGLYHAKKFDSKRADIWMENDDYASLPPTTGNDKRPYMLVTQQKIKSDNSVADYFVYNGKLRDLCCCKCAPCVESASLSSTCFCPPGQMTTSRGVRNPAGLGHKTIATFHVASLVRFSI